MTRIINAVLISLLAFFVFVGVLWQFTGDGAEGRRSPGGAPTVSGIDAAWQPGETKDLLIEMQVHNPSSIEGRVTSVSYEVQVEGKVVDSAVSRPVSGPGGSGTSVALPAKQDASVEVPIDLPEEFVLDWWPTYMAEGEEADVSIQGSLAVERDDGDRSVPFEWRSSWQGDLAKSLSDAVANCEGEESDVCLDGGVFAWKDGGLHADLTFHNPGASAVALRNTTLTMTFGDDAVVAGDVDLVQEVAPDGDAEVGLALTFSPVAMQAWWEDHVARCESTPVALRMQLQVEVLDGSGGEGEGEDDEAEVVSLQWTFPVSPFQTRFVCAP